MSVTLFTLVFFIFTTTTTITASLPENLIPSLKSKNITSVHLPSPNPQLISLFSNTNISLLLSIPNSLIPSFSSSHTCATSAWLFTHVTPFLPHVRISAISVGNNLTDANLLKLLPPAIDNVREKVKEFGIDGVKVSSTVSLGFVTGNECVAKGLLASLSDEEVALFVNVKPWNVSFKEVVCGGFVLKRDLRTDGSYESFDNGEMMDYGVVEVRVSRVEEDKFWLVVDTVRTILRTIVHVLSIFYYMFILLVLVVIRR